jgi:hypothetical protein
VPHTGARPSACLSVGPELACCVHLNLCPAFLYVGHGPVVARARGSVQKVLDRGAQSVVRGGARWASQVIGRAARPMLAAPRTYLIVVSRRMPAAPLVVFAGIGRGAQLVAAAATLSQQVKNNSADVQRKRANFTHMQRRIIRIRLGRFPRRRSLFSRILSRGDQVVAAAPRHCRNRRKINLLMCCVKK